MPTKQLQIIKMPSPALRPRDDVVHRQMLRQEMRPATVTVAALSAVKHNLRLAQRRLRFTIRPHRNVGPRDRLDTAPQTQFVVSTQQTTPSSQPHSLDRRDPEPAPDSNREEE